MDDDSNNFVKVFNDIEEWLNKQCRTTQYETFATLIEKCKRHPVVRRHTYELRIFGNLRNLVAHGEKLNHPIAMVHPDTVVEAKALRARLLRPPSLGSVAKRKVFTCKPDEPIRPVLAMMHEKDYSQVPVYSETGIVGMLNTETISRWLAAELDRGETVFGDEAVGDAMKCRNKVKTYRVLSETQTIVDAISLFDEGYEQARPVDGVIVTQSGKKSEAATGIITIHDLPELLDFL